MIDEKILEKTILTAINTGKVLLGAKEVSNSIKGNKIIIFSTSLSNTILSNLKEICNLNSIPIIPFNGDSIKLGKICRKPFKVSILGIRVPGDADISLIVSSKNE